MENIDKMIEENRLGEAIQALKAKTTDKKFIKELIQLQNRKSGIDEEVRLGVTSRDEARITEDKLVKSFLDLAALIEEEEQEEKAQEAKEEPRQEPVKPREKDAVLDIPSSENPPILDLLINTIQFGAWKNIWLKLAGAALVLLNPFAIDAYIRALGDLAMGWQVPELYGFYFKLGILLLVVIAFIQAVVQTYRSTQSVSTLKYDKASAIKGLQPFTASDAEIFRKLQRDNDIRELRLQLLEDHFSVGVLSGVSGCGKTSFLQAGLLPALETQGTKVVYVKFANDEPIHLISWAFEEALGIPFSSNTSFTDLLDAAQEKIGHKPLILLFDQFEQFFAHCQTQASREPFIRELKAWYQKQGQVQTKILFSVRSDFVDYLFEIQEALGYELSTNKNYFKLWRFTPRQATEIFKVVAYSEKIVFDEPFVLEMCKDELADKEDQLISAVDIQILSLMLKGQKTVEGKAFNRRAYERFGGIEGLLQRFLKEQLETPTIHNREQSALKVLLSLIDLDRNVRAGTLTKANIQRKLQGVVNSVQIPPILKWLGQIRLISEVVLSNHQMGYELAHERLILPLRNLAGKSLSTSEQISNLLDRRVNEWLGNDKQSRYLLSIKECLNVRKYKNLIEWGPNKAYKDQLLATSWKRIGFLWGGGGLVALMFLMPWLWMSYHPAGIMWNIKHISLGVNLQNTGDATKSELVKQSMPEDRETAYYVLNRIEDPWVSITTTTWLIDSLHSLNLKKEAQELFDQIDTHNISKIEDARYKSSALRYIAQSSAQMGDTTQAIAWLKTSAASADQIESVISKSYALRYIAQSIARMGDTTQAIAWLKTLTASADQIEDDREKSDALIQIAQSSAQMGDTTQASVWLKTLAASADQFEYDSDKSYALTQIAQSSTRMGDTTQAIAWLKTLAASADQIEDDREKSDALIQIAQSSAQIGEVAIPILTKLAASADQIEETGLKSYVLRDIAQSITQMGEVAMPILTKLTASADQIEYASYKSSALSDIAQSSAQIGEVAMPILTKLAASADQIKEDHFGSKSLVLTQIAQSSAQIGEVAIPILTKLAASADQIEYASYKSSALSDIAQSSAQMGDTTQASVWLKNSAASADQIEGAREKSNALIQIAQSSAQIGEVAIPILTKLAASADQIEDDRYKSDALAQIAQSSAQMGDTTQAIAWLKTSAASTDQIEYASSKSDALIQIAQISAQMGDTTQAVAWHQASIEYNSQVKEAASKSSLITSLAALTLELYPADQTDIYLDKLLQMAIRIQDEISLDSNNYKDPTLRALVGYAAKSGHWRLANEIVGLLPQTYKAGAMVDMLNIWAEKELENSEDGSEQAEEKIEKEDD